MKEEHREQSVGNMQRLCFNFIIYGGILQLKVLRSIIRSAINSIPGTQRTLLSWEFLSPEVAESKWEQIMEDRVIEAHIWTTVLRWLLQKQKYGFQT